MAEVTKQVRDAAGNLFTMRFWDDGSGDLAGIDYVIATGSSATITKIDVTTSAASLSSLLTAASSATKSGRIAIELQNRGAGKVYIGAAGVTTSTGRELDATIGDGTWSIPLDDASEIYLIGNAAATVIVTQV